MTFLEEAHHWGQVWCFKSLPPSLVLSLLPVCGSRCELSPVAPTPWLAGCLPAVTLPALLVMNSYFSGTLNFKQTLLEVVLIMLFYHSKRKVRKTQPMPTTVIRLEEKHSGWGTVGIWGLAFPSYWLLFLHFDKNTWRNQLEEGRICFVSWWRRCGGSHGCGSGSCQWWGSISSSLESLARTGVQLQTISLTNTSLDRNPFQTVPWPPRRPSVHTHESVRDISLSNHSKHILVYSLEMLLDYFM